MAKKIKFCVFAAMLCMALGMNAQVTTSAMAGVVVDENNETMVGATVSAVHTPSGTKYNAVSNIDGRFTIQGMRTGGPYRVEVSYVGYQPSVYNDVFLQLGNTYQLNVAMVTDARALSEVVVTAKGREQQAGASHNFSEAKIAEVATIERNVYDVVKNMPMANRSKIGGISFAGSNNRYNSFQIDGSVHNDVFGLASSGTNGGQASANPISMDAIQEIQVVIAPFDVRQSGFTGGGINIITKQGTNDFHASYFTYFNNQSFYGRYNAANDYAKEKLTKQHFLTIGGNVSGPIVKDKLFFFVNVENHNESYPGSFYPGSKTDYLNPLVAEAIVQRYHQLTGIQETYNQRDVKRNAFEFLARLDWNINDSHKLALRYQHGNAYDDKWSAGNTSYYFNNSSYRFNNVTNSFVAELNSNFGGSFYNELRANYTRVRDNRDVPYQGPLFWMKNLPSATGTRSNITVNLGTEYSSGANSLDQDIYMLEDNLSWYKGNHTFTFGTHNEFFRMKNLFIQAVNGEWVFNSLGEFGISLDDAGNPLTDASGNFIYGPFSPTQFVFKCTDPTVTGGNLRWTPIIKAGQFGAYVQDKWDVTRNLQLTYGIRFDIPVLFNDPTVNEEFNVYAEARRLGVKVGEMPSTKLMLSPRFGFRWYADDAHKTLIRGGAGLFTGRVPFVWLSNAFSNTGIEVTGTTINNPSLIPEVTNNPQVLADALGKGTAPTPDIVTVSRRFRYPQVFRANLAWEQILPYDWKLTLEGLYTKTFNQAYFKNLALTQNGSIYAVKGVQASAAPFYAVDNKYYSIVNLENTDKGYSYNLTATIEKKFHFGLDVLASYTYGRSKSIYDGTSSVAYSNWKYNYAIDTNNPRLTYSSFDQPHRVLVSVGYTSPKYLNGLLQTNVAVTYNGTSGQRYSLTMSENADYNGDGYRGNSMLYLPTTDELANMVFTSYNTKVNGETVEVTPDDQRAMFEEFLSTDGYAKNHRGQYADRNGNVAPFEHQIDLHFAESIFALRERGSKIMLTLDILNFANMLNKKWGANYSGVYNVSPLKYTGASRDANGVYTAKYQWNDYTEPSKANISSRWHMQVGVKLIF